MAGDGRIVIDVILDDGSVVKGVADLDGKIKGLGDSGEKAALGIGSIITALGLVALAKGAIDLVKGSIDKAFGRIDTMEQFERVMTTMTGSTEKANDVLAKTNEVVKGTAYGLDIGARAVQNFVTSNMDVDKATGTLAAWGDAVAFYGDGSNDTFASVSDAIAKMVAKGKVQMDTMNRFTEAGIPAMQIYADATGQSVEEVADQMSKGKLDATKFLDVMNDALMNGTKKFAGIEGAAKEAGASWGGSFDNMGAAVARGVTNIIQAIDTMLTTNGLPDMRGLIAEFGSKFEEVLTKVADTIPAVVDKIKEVYNILEPWMPLIKALAITLGTFVVALATINSTVAVSTVVWKALNKALMANPWVLITAAVIAAAVAIYIYWDPIKEFFINLWSAIKESGLAIWDVLKNAWSATVEWFKGIWSGITGFFSNLWNETGEGALSIWEILKGVWQSTIDWFKNIWSSISEFFVGLWSDIVETATSNWDKFVSKLTAIVGFVTTIFSPMIDFFSKTWTSILQSATKTWDNLTAFFSVLWTNIQVIASSAWEIIKNVILGPILLLINLVTGDMEGFKANLEAIWTNISEAAGRIWSALKEIVSAYITGLVDNAILLWTGFTETFTNLLEALKETFSNIWTTIVDFVIERIAFLGEKVDEIMQSIKDAIDIAWAFIEDLWMSALEKIAEVTGVNFESIRENVTNVMDAIKEIIDTVWNFIKESFQIALLTLRALVTGDFKVMKDMIGEQMKLIKETISKIWENIKKIFNNALSAVKTFVTQGFENLKNTAMQKMSEMWTNIKNAWENIKTSFSNSIENIKTTVKTKFNDLKNSASDKMNETKDKIAEIWENVMSFFRDIDLKQIGKDVIQGLINGIKSKVTAVGNAVKEVTSAITGKIKSILKIASPSKVMIQMGEWTGEGVEVGLEKSVKGVSKAAGEMAKSAMPDMPKVGNFVNRLRGVTAPIGNVMPISAVGNTSNKSRTNQTDLQNGAPDKQSAVINVYVGSKKVASEIVDDITDMQNRKSNRKRKGPRGGGAFA